jgi:hypothetical protein
LVLYRNFRLGIEPDAKTALLAGELVGWLCNYNAKAKVAEPIAPDLELTLVMELLKTCKNLI